MKNSQIQTSSIESRYNKALKVLQGFLSKKMALNTVVNPNWIGASDCFWYVRDTKNGKEFRVVDAKNRSNKIAFNHGQLAEVLSNKSGQTVEANALPFNGIELSLDPLTVSFTAFDKRWNFDSAQGSCLEISMPVAPHEIISPDGRFLVFCKDYNLWLRDIASGDEKPLTTDGEKDYVYGEPNTAWGFSQTTELQVRWSPDSQRIFTVQKDTRKVEALPLTQHVPQDGSIRPQVSFPKVAYPGDEHIETLRLLTVEIETGHHQAASYAQVPVTRNNYCFFSSNFGWWHNNSKVAYFVDVDRYYKYVRVVEFDSESGKTKVLFEETSETQLNLMSNGDMWPSFVPLPDTNELLWYSERSGWAHLYLYDLNTGELKNSVTEGEWLVRDVVTVNPQRREAFIQTACRSSGRNPYYRDLAKVHIDTGELTTLASSDHDYFAGAFTDMQGFGASGLSRQCLDKRGMSPSGNFGVITQSRVDTLPESIVVDDRGNHVMTLELTELVGAPDGWKLPEPVAMKAADGSTDIYGVVYRPSNFSPEKSYPVINDTFSTPDFPWMSIGSFDNSFFEGQSFYTAAALAELGFIVVQIEGRGASYRENAFKEADYGNLQLPTMRADQVAGLQQLIERYSYMDGDRVGIHESQGGPSVLHGMLDYHDFYKVGVTNMPHDARLMSASMWGDMYEGVDRHKEFYPEDKLKNLQGKLLISGGMLDVCTPPAGVFRLVEALQKANKDFDMLLLPNQGHWFAPYLVRRAWDYFVLHLLDEEPPADFCLSGLFGST